MLRLGGRDFLTAHPGGDKLKKIQERQNLLPGKQGCQKENAQTEATIRSKGGKIIHSLATAVTIPTLRNVRWRACTWSNTTT